MEIMVESSKLRKKDIVNLILSCFLMYTLSICLKMVYSASIVEIRRLNDVNMQTTSLPILLYYLIYAVTQIVLAVFIVKINLKKYMFVTLLLSAISFGLIFFIPTITFISIVMAFNGFSLASAWCGVAYYCGRYLSGKIADKAFLFLGAGFSVGSAISYGISSFSLFMGDWRLTFLISSILFFFSIFYFYFSVSGIEKKKISIVSEKIQDSNVFIEKEHRAIPLYVMALIICFFSGFVYYAYSNWMPSILVELFGVSTANATLITTLFPIVIYFGPLISAIIGNKVRNDFYSIFILSLCCLVIALIFYFLYDVNLVLTVILLLFIGIAFRSVIYCLSVSVPLHIKTKINIGASSAVINAIACFASAVSPFIVGIIKDNSGESWNSCFLVLFIVSAVMLAIATFFALYSINMDKKFK